MKSGLQLLEVVPLGINFIPRANHVPTVPSFHIPCVPDSFPNQASHSPRILNSFNLTKMPSTINPPSRLWAPPKNGCLHEKDGREFSALLQSGRLAANTISGHYPKLSTHPGLIFTVSSSYGGQILLAHLSSLMYSYWDSAPSGPSAYHIAHTHLRPPLDKIAREETISWGTHRLNAPHNEFVYIIEDTDAGSIVANHTMTTFHLVLGMRTSPAAALVRAGISLPCKVRLTALPFRGALVYDGLLGGAGPVPVAAADRTRLLERYASARQNGQIVTGFLVDTTLPAETDVKKTDRPLETLSDSEKSAVNAINSARKKDGMLVFRRFGYSEQENPRHIIVMIDGNVGRGTFMSQALVPRKDEILEEIVKLTRSGRISRRIAVDDKLISEEVRVVTSHAGLEVGFYPPPCPEDLCFMETVPDGMLEQLRDRYGG